MIILPVIHYLDDDLSLINARTAFDAGCQGVFLISHRGNDAVIPAIASKIKRIWPEKLVGINMLYTSSLLSLDTSIEHGLDATWDDAPGVSSDHVSAEALEIRDILEKHHEHQYFGSVAFKYQRPEKNPGEAARRAFGLGMIPTTSGEATGVPPSVEKISSMRCAKLAIASGITPENVSDYKGLATHILVSTGITGAIEDVFCGNKIKQLISNSN